MPKIIGVYAITHRVSGRRYIGSSIDVAGRWSRHLRYLRNRRHQRLLQRAWDKYGADAFDFTVVELCSVKELRVREQAWIDWSRAADPEFGFNHLPLAQGGPPPLGQTWLEATVKANSARRIRERPWKRPIKGSPKSRHISEALMGTPHSESRRAKLRLVMADPAVKAKQREGILRSWERRRKVYGPSGGVAPGRPDSLAPMGQ